MRPRISKVFRITPKRAQELRDLEVAMLGMDIVALKAELKSVRKYARALIKSPLPKTERRAAEVKPGEKYDPMDVLYEPERLYGKGGISWCNSIKSQSTDQK